MISFWLQQRMRVTNTDHLLNEGEHRCEHETLRSEVDNAEEQCVKDQQRGLVSVKEHIAERVSLVCRGRNANKWYTQVQAAWVQTYSSDEGQYRCKRCFFRWVQGTPFLWPFPASACPSLYSPFRGRPEEGKSPYVNSWAPHASNLQAVQMYNTDVVNDWSQKVVDVVVGSGILLKLVSRACIHQSGRPISLETECTNSQWKDNF